MPTSNNSIVTVAWGGLRLLHVQKLLAVAAFADVPAQPIRLVPKDLQFLCIGASKTVTQT
jgi:hypothetical protein